MTKIDARCLPSNKLNANDGDESAKEDAIELLTLSKISLTQPWEEMETDKEIFFEFHRFIRN